MYTAATKKRSYAQSSLWQSFVYHGIFIGVQTTPQNSCLDLYQNRGLLGWTENEMHEGIESTNFIFVY